MRCPKELMINPEISTELWIPSEYGEQECTNLTTIFWIDLVDKYYKKQFIEGWRMGYQTTLNPGPREAITNAICHGDFHRNGLGIGIFLSPEDVVWGVCDGGDYFKKSQVKEIWEEKKGTSTRGIQYDSGGDVKSGFNLGRESMRYLDKVYIHQTTGTLYGKFNIENLLEKRSINIEKIRNQ